MEKMRQNLVQNAVKTWRESLYKRRLAEDHAQNIPTTYNLCEGNKA